MDPQTGRCVLCSRTCIRCGAKLGRVGRDLCGRCLAADRRAAAWQPCPRCGKPGRIRPDTGWCGSCSRPGRPPAPDAVCRSCATTTHLVGAGLCRACYPRSPHQITVRADNLAAALEAPPTWLGDFADYLAPRHHPQLACQIITALGRVLRDGGPVHPRALLERAGTVSVPLARALEDYLVRNHLVLPLSHQDDAAALRRDRRLQAIPAPLRAAAEAFTDHELNGRRRAEHAGTRPPQHTTIEAHLTTIRDLAQYLTTTGTITDWATVNTGDIEAFLATQPSTAAHRLAGLRRFFRFAAGRRLILTDPTRGITVTPTPGFRGPTLSLHRQRDLFGRWTSGREDVHPHEAAVGLLALIHGVSTQEIRHLRADAIDAARHSVHLPGRPYPTPLDPWTWTTIHDCLAHRAALGGDNPYLLVTRVTKATRAPASDGYVKNTVAPAGVRPRILRSTRLLAMVNTTDPKLVAVALGLTREAVTAYLADRVDPTRLANL
ncbi:MAG TPA: site-specific integrase [Kineosporiaceae bacterium]|nr:site-specific integrase [Kineosporiaceae bacterium]